MTADHTSEELAWAAGLFEGEGTITIAVLARCRAIASSRAVVLVWPMRSARVPVDGLGWVTGAMTSMPKTTTEADPRPHYAVRVTNVPPTEIVCKCGERFVGGDVIAKQKAHMDKENR